MTQVGVFLPGDSVVHRLGAGIKLGLLALYAASTVLITTPYWAAGALGVALAGYAAARLGPLVPLRQLRAVWVFVVAIGLAQWWLTSATRALVVTVLLVSVLLAAMLVSLTTRTTAMVDALVRCAAPLRRFGVDPDRLAVQLALGIRAVPLVLALAQTTREAQRARGLTSSPRAFGVPLIVRALHHADRVGEALQARGFDD